MAMAISEVVTNAHLPGISSRRENSMSQTIRFAVAKTAVLLTGILLSAYSWAGPVPVQCVIGQTKITCSAKDSSFTFVGRVDHSLGAGTDNNGSMTFNNGDPSTYRDQCNIYDAKSVQGTFTGTIACGANHSATLKFTIGSFYTGPLKGSGSFSF